MDDGVQMEDAADDDESVPPSPMHCTMSTTEVCAHYMDPPRGASYEIRLDCWQYRHRVTEVAAANKECDHEVGEVLFGEAGNEKDIAEATPRCHDHEVGMSTGTAGSEEE